MSTPRGENEAEYTDDKQYEIMRGVYQALCGQGITDLTMADIAAEADVSKALLHYHYDTKHKLLLAYLEYAQDWYEAHIAEIKKEHETAIEQLEAVLDTFVTDPNQYNRAYLQLRLQAVHDEVFRDACQARRETIIGELSALIARGIEEGDIREGDPDRLASNLYTTMDGARVHHVVLGEDADPQRIKQDALDYLRRDTHLD